MSSLSKGEKMEIGQHFVFGFHGYEPSADVVKLIKDYYVGNIIIMKRNVQSITQLRKLVCSLQSIARNAGHERPLLIGIDQENGLVSAFSTLNGEAGTQFPGAMALASTGLPSLAQEVSYASAQEMRIAGINWAYSPVADVNNNPRNPVIGVRSYGEDPRTVSLFAAAVAHGLAAAGIAPCAKHFPGHGDTHVDSHLALPIIERTLQQLAENELVPFRSLISEDVLPSVMTGHMALPALSVKKGDVPEGNTPASLSKTATTHLLREELGYEGVIVTDCLEMSAISDTTIGGPGTPKGAALSLQAGADIAMVCHTFERQMGAVEKVYDCVANGQLSMNDLRTSGRRISAMKEKYTGDWRDALQEDLDVARWEALKAENDRVSRSAYKQAMRFMEPGGVPVASSEFISLNPKNSVAICVPRMQRINPAVDDAKALSDVIEGVQKTADGYLRNTAGPSFGAFKDEVARQLHKGTNHWGIVYQSPQHFSEDEIKILGTADVVLFCLKNANQPSSKWQLESLHSTLDWLKNGARAVVLMTCGPYDLLGAHAINKGLIDRGELVLCTYEFTKEALVAAVHALYGTNEE